MAISGNGAHRIDVISKVEDARAIAAQQGIEAKIAGEIVPSPGILIKPRTAFALTHSPLIFR